LAFLLTVLRYKDVIPSRVYSISACISLMSSSVIKGGFEDAAVVADYYLK
jgi:hypothetical protein